MKVRWLALSPAVTTNLCQGFGLSCQNRSLCVCPRSLQNRDSGGTSHPVNVWVWQGPWITPGLRPSSLDFSWSHGHVKSRIFSPWFWHFAEDQKEWRHCSGALFLFVYKCACVCQMQVSPFRSIHLSVENGIFNFTCHFTVILPQATHTLSLFLFWFLFFIFV